MEPIRLKKDIYIPIPVKLLKNLFSEAGYDLYLVGGAVRDSLMGNKVKDYDLATNALPHVITSILDDKNIRYIGIGAKFGVINAILDGEEYEIATFREDSELSDGRRPDSVTFSDIETDVKRRDFTINALFYDLSTYEVVDYVGGIRDIERRLINTVGEPNLRFEEDKLRILRAIRFSHKLEGILSYQIIRYLYEGCDLSDISSERIRDEFLKTLKVTTQDPIDALEDFKRFELFGWIFPGMVLNYEFSQMFDYRLILAKLLKNDTNLANNLNKLSYTNEEIRDIRFLIKLDELSIHNVITLKKLYKNTSFSDGELLTYNYDYHIDVTLLSAFLKFELTVRGDIIMDEMGLIGEEIGETIKKIETYRFLEIMYE